MSRQFSAPCLSASCVKKPEHRLSKHILTVVIVLAVLFAGVRGPEAAFPGLEGVPAVPASQAAFETWLRDTGWPVNSRYRGLTANFETWRDYRLLVYGRPSQVSGNRYDSQTGQYAGLGFSYDEFVVTNSLFPDDSPGGVTRTNPWQWQQLDMGQSARISWARLTDRQKVFIRQSTLTYRNNNYGGMTFAGLGLAENTTVVLAPPSWHLGFALYTNHYLPGSTANLRYATFNGPGAGDVRLSSSIDLLTPAAADGNHVIGSQQQSIDIHYLIRGGIQSYTGLASGQDIRVRGIGNEASWAIGSGSGPWTTPAVLRVSRADLGDSGVKSFKLTGQAWVVSHLGDMRIARAERTVTVRAEKIEPPFAVDIRVKGAIAYFSGRVNGQGIQLVNNPRRFLGYEKIHINLTFSREPAVILCSLGDASVRIEGRPGILSYETSLIVPARQTTLTWLGSRLRQPLSLVIQANESRNPASQISAALQGIEITGTVFDIAHVQAGQ